MQDLIRINGNHFLDNRATFGGGINSASPQARPVIYNNVFINNSASKAAGLIVWGESTISKNHFQNSLTGDPAFKNPTANDFHLRLTSAARDAGTSGILTTQDIDGNPRPIGSAPDIGAYEYLPAGFMYLPLIKR
jgi:hypothetical protein